MVGQYLCKKVGFLFVLLAICVIAMYGSGCSDEGGNEKTDLPTAKSSQTAGTKSPSDQFPKIVKVGLASYEPADNSGCQVCHYDFGEEELSVKHEEAGVGCNSCHGISENHSQDELNILFPDYLFGRAEIVGFCKTCHTEEHPKGKMYELFMKKWEGKYRPHGRMVSDKSICTYCHGKHAIISEDKLHFLAE